MSKASAKLAVLPIANVSATNVVKAACVSRYVDAMTIAATEKFAKILFVLLVVDRMQIVKIAWPVLVSVVLIHAKIQLPAAQMPIVSSKTMPKPAFVQIIWLEIQRSVVNMHRPHAPFMMNVHQIILAMVMCAKPIVIPIKIA